jgi:putative membrane protein
MRFIIYALAAAAGFWIASRLVHGVHVHDTVSLLLAGVVLGILNALIRPILAILTFPLTILTLGLFLFVINGITVWLVTAFIHGVQISGLWPAILTALIISITVWLTNMVFGEFRRG